MTFDHFAHKASDYERKHDRVENVARIATAMLERIHLAKSMHVMDFGSGTGLLLERIAPHVGKITAVDVSQSMNAQLRAKLDRLACPVDILAVDLARVTLAQRFDGVISSMTMHHIQDIPAMFRKFHALLHAGGFIAIADLDVEDGSFHREDTGVHHLGFDRSQMTEIAVNAGFKDVAISTASTVRKEQGEFSVFLLVAYKGRT